MKRWRVVLAGFMATLLMDMIMHIETDPQWVLYIHNIVWFGFGCALGETSQK